MLARLPMFVRNNCEFYANGRVFFSESSSRRFLILYSFPRARPQLMYVKSRKFSQTRAKMVENKFPPPKKRKGARYSANVCQFCELTAVYFIARRGLFVARGRVVNADRDSTSTRDAKTNESCNQLRRRGGEEMNFIVSVLRTRVVCAVPSPAGSGRHTSRSRRKTVMCDA